MDQALHRVVGIDLGTTYSAVAAFNPDDFNPEIITDADRTGPAAAAAPSVVRLDADTGALAVGHDAKDAIADQSVKGEAVIEVKREMGETFADDAALERFGVTTEFKVGEPVRVRLGDEWYRPQEISALVLMHMKRIAEKGLDTEIHDAVVTVPAYFTERQKKATEEAALLAGLYPRQLIPEPTAAAIAYGVDRAETERQIYMVFDLGGGTFDVSIIETSDNRIEVIATDGDRRLGGGDFDDAIVKWIEERIGRAPADRAERLRVKAAAESAKRELSLRSETDIDLGAEPFTLDRSTFEELISEPLRRSLRKVENALAMAEKAKGVKREDVNAVLLVGGSTRIPSIKQMLLDHFEQEDEFVRADANPDTLVARGAAIVAHRFEPSEGFDLAVRPTAEREVDDEDESFDITLITEHTLGVAVYDESVKDNRFDPLIARGTKVPAKRVKRYFNGSDQSRIDAQIFQGESEHLWDDTLVGTILLDDIEPRPAGYHQFDVEFALDVNGLLSVRVTHVNTSREFKATFEQVTQIGKLDELAERRDALLRLAGSATPAPVHTGPPAGTPAPTGIPAPINADIPAPINAAAPAEVPAEFRRLVGKVERVAPPGELPAPLQAALDAFLSAVGAGADPQTLDDLADRLEDALDDARR